MSEATSEDDDGGIFCQSCSPSTRKLGYYLQFGVGVILFGYGLFRMFKQDNIFLVIGSFVVLLCPLWIKSCCGYFKDFKNALKLISTIIFVGFLVVVFLDVFIKFLGTGTPGFVRGLFGFCLFISGIWYFLSFFPGGQEWCMNCIKGCCTKS